MLARPHTCHYYDAALTTLQERILEMGGLVERQIASATTAFVDRDSELARRIMDRDSVLDELDMHIDELCIRLLARHQPTGRDLRLITAGSKISTDLERIGGLAVHLCACTVELNSQPLLEVPIDLPRMADGVQLMLRQGLDAFVRQDAELALHVCAADCTIDDLNDQFYRQLVGLMVQRPEAIGRAIRLAAIAKDLERIGDHATNIAEAVVFVLTGKSIRHVTRAVR